MSEETKAQVVAYADWLEVQPEETLPKLWVVSFLKDGCGWKYSFKTEEKAREAAPNLKSKHPDASMEIKQDVDWQATDAMYEQHLTRNESHS